MTETATNVLVVTGGASGIGLACAQRMASDHGKVVLLDRNAEALEQAVTELKQAGSQAFGIPCDVSDADALSAIAAQVEADHGPVDTLVTSAGIISNTETLMEMDLDRHREVWDVNYHGTVYAVRAFARAMQDRGRGRIVTLGSITGMGAFPLPAYSPGKTAITRLTQILSVELGRFGIRVNCVAPTYVLSETMKQRIAEGLRDGEAIRKAGALSTYVLPEDIADAAAFLCSDAAKVITGVLLPVDAGWQAATIYRSYTGGVPWAEAE
ncbi:SDR family oxidoreductase [Roseovarius gahaiensis]|uniref:SDR family oxidoreductase n=1 Tax=Roseovarius gahaiensis TaxID=2716691 RepID=A0A967EGP8_9RHOB|nr:SDR family oxidoreductase [Roseovarius gahaiensis]NHQ74885.1 SDR family oxidoreductase [Roseovarius gahaiensis]